MQRRRSLARPAILAVLTLSLLAAAFAPSAVADCWGCSNNECSFGFKSGGFLCRDFVGECSLLARLTGSCVARACEVSDPCSGGQRPVTPIVEPDPADEDEKRLAKDDATPGPLDVEHDATPLTTAAAR